MKKHWLVLICFDFYQLWSLKFVWRAIKIKRWISSIKYLLITWLLVHVSSYTREKNNQSFILKSKVPNLPRFQLVICEAFLLFCESKFNISGFRFMTMTDVTQLIYDNYCLRFGLSVPWKVGAVTMVWNWSVVQIPVPKFTEVELDMRA